MSDLKPISKSDLIEIANHEIVKHEQYIEGLKVTDVVEKDSVLIFKGEYFLDASGLPTSKTTVAFNLYKFLAHVMSKEYTLKD
ncbi:DUF2498 family protein [Vibrio sp.]|uniref:DUF2498 family protein n=1 Tax=Vibrio viridaestus TaxID=2487322 RepID=A0A3N9TCN5_9VIBR|nr:DUF2498 family protein [Vibrio viridaestus]MDC0609479.1 DUF2498 family protein [Vibrio sp.]RQW61957.1 DUF2498 family protein [Vibrio viridaestus]